MIKIINNFKWWYCTKSSKHCCILGVIITTQKISKLFLYSQIWRVHVIRWLHYKLMDSRESDLFLHMDVSGFNSSIFHIPLIGEIDILQYKYNICSHNGNIAIRLCEVGWTKNFSSPPSINVYINFLHQKHT